MDTTRRRGALSYWRWVAVGIFCLAFDWVFLWFWFAFGCVIGGPDCWIPPDTARDTVLGTGSLLVVSGGGAIYLACRGRRHRHDHGDRSGGDSVHHAAAD